MRLITCLLLALGTGIAGFLLRAAVPVTPVDQGFRDLLPWYQAGHPPEPGRSPPVPSNTPETSAP
ncbi:hypothetical protein [Methylobacterium sp. Leaf118]|uniref:hypothetical protein n=1 Tax=Methylobacterium sp. Leaf118 TaxID=2876562 RepID=UPI001E5640F0|nr:hypothetical protein [Methylobacterium sp. Leaf118]